LKDYSVLMYNPAMPDNHLKEKLKQNLFVFQIRKRQVLYYPGFEIEIEKYFLTVMERKPEKQVG